MIAFGFVYIWHDRKRKMFYVGSHMGSENDGYVCSSRRMLYAYAVRPQDFKRRILYRMFVNDPVALRLIEGRWLLMMRQQELGRRYYNLSTAVQVAFLKGCRASDETRLKMSVARMGRLVSLETREKIRISNTGKKASAETLRKLRESHLGQNKGRPRSEVTKEKLRIAHKGKKGRPLSLEERAHLSRINKGRPGKPHSAETKEKMRLIRTGTKMPVESRAKISAAMKGRPGRVWSEEQKRRKSEQYTGVKRKPHSLETIERLCFAAKRRESRNRQERLMAELFRQQQELPPEFLTPSAITAGLMGMIG